LEIYRSEQEQVDAIKQWWEKNGKFVIVVGVLAISATVGGRVWKEYQNNEMGKASSEFELVLKGVESGKPDDALPRAGRVVEQFSGTAYAPMAALAQARMETDKGDISSAKLRLNWVIEHANIDEIKQVARLRLGRLLYAEGKLDEALAATEASDVGVFRPAFEALRGDIYAAKGQTVQARNAYQAAAKSEDLGGQSKSLIEMKLDDLGGQEATATTGKKP